jgi:hypothetical protein
MNQLNREKIIEILKQEFNYLNERYHLRKIGLFGSYALNMNTKGSDVDLIVDFDKPIGLEFVDLGDYLEKLFDRKVDLITYEGLKNSRINLNIEKQIIYVN